MKNKANITIATKDFVFRLKNIAAKGPSQKVLCGFCILAFVSYFFYLVTAVLFERILFADGSFFFVSLLGRDFPVWPYADDFKHIRLAVNLLNQLPVATGISLGLTDLRYLKILFGAGYYLIPALIYSYCFWLSNRAQNYLVFCFSLLSFVAFSMPSEIFAVNQALTSVALCWVILHYLLLDLKLKRIDQITIAFTSLILFRSHEGMILWGTVFTLVAVTKLVLLARKGSTTPPITTVFIGLMGVLQVSFAVYWQLSHPVSEQTNNFIQIVTRATPESIFNGTAQFTIVGLTLFLCLFSPWLERIKYLIAISGGAILFFHALNHWGSPELVFPFSEYNTRVLIPFGSPILMMCAALFVLFPRLRAPRIRDLVFIIAISIFTLSLWQIGSNFQWRAFQKQAKETLSYSENLLVSPDEVRRSLIDGEHEHLYRYSWAWTWPIYGLALQDGPQVERLFYPTNSLDNFVIPKDSEEMPIFPSVFPQKDGYFKFRSFIQTCAQENCFVKFNSQ